MSGRFEIRETERSPEYVARLRDLAPDWADRPLFEVWDTTAGYKILFGNFGSRERAQRRIDCMDPADYCASCGLCRGVDLEAWRDRRPCARPDWHRPGEEL